MASSPDDIAAILATPAPASEPDIGAILGSPAPTPAPGPHVPLAPFAYPRQPWPTRADVTAAQRESEENPTPQTVAEDIDEKIAAQREYLSAGGFTGAGRAMGHFVANYGHAVAASEKDVFSHKTLEGESFLESPVKSVTQVVGQVPQFVASVAGAIAGAADTRLYDAKTGARIESAFDKALPTLTHGYIAGEEPSTELGREVNAAVGFLFAPATALGPAVEQTQHDITGTQSPYLHYVAEGISDVTGIAAGAGLGRVAGALSKRKPTAAAEAPPAAAPPEPSPETPPPTPSPAGAPAPDQDLHTAREDLRTAMANHHAAQGAYREALQASATRGSSAVKEAQAARQRAEQRAQPEAVRKELANEYRAMDVRAMGRRAADDPTVVRQRRKLVERDLAERQAMRNQEAADAAREHDKLARQHATRMRKQADAFEEAVKAAPHDPLAGLPPHIRAPLERALVESQQRYLRALHARRGAPEDVRHAVEVQELSEEDLSPEDRALVQQARERATAEAQRKANEPERMTPSRHAGEAEADRLGLRKAVHAVLGPELAKRVRFVKDESGLPGGAAVGERPQPNLRVSGLHTHEGHVYVVTDTVKTPERAVWTAVHEAVGHGGMAGLVDRFKHLASEGEPLHRLYTKAREALLTNPTVSALADRIAAERRSTDRTRMAEEAAAELQAARVTGRWEALKQRYGVEVPETVRTGVEAALSPWRRAIQRIVNTIAEHVLGRKPATPFERAMRGDAVFNDKDIHDLLLQMHEHAGRDAEAPETMESRVPTFHEVFGLDAKPQNIADDPALAGTLRTRSNGAKVIMGMLMHARVKLLDGSEEPVTVGGGDIYGLNNTIIDPNAVVAFKNNGRGSAWIKVRHGIKSNTGSADALKVRPSPFTPEEQAQLDAATRSLGFSDRLNERLAGEQEAAKESHAFDEAQTSSQNVEHAAAGAFGHEDAETVAHVEEDGRGPAHAEAARVYPWMDEHGNIDFSDLQALDDMDQRAEIPLGRQRRPGGAFKGWFPAHQPGLTEAGVRVLQNLSDAEGTVAKGLEAMKKLWQGMQTMFPDITKPEISKAAAAMLERVSSARAEAARYSRNMRSFARLIARLTKDQQLAVYRLAEQGTTRDAVRGVDVPLPENVDWQGWFRYIRHVHDRAFDAINRARGADVIKYRQNHFARFVKILDGNMAGAVYDSASAGLTTETFEHARRFPTMDSLYNKQDPDAPRFTHYSLNLAMNEIRWAQSVQRYVARWETTRTLARMGAIRTVPEDYVKTPDEEKFMAPDRQSWLAGPRTLMAAMANGPFAEPLMGRGARMASATIALGRPLWNSVTQSALALSLYHPFAITFYSAPVHALTESLALVRDPWSIQGVTDIAKAFAKALPGAPGRSFVAGEHLPAHEALALLSGKRGGLTVDKATGRVSMPDEDPAEVALDIMRGLRSPSDAAPAHVELMRRMAIGGMHVWGKGEFRNEAMDHFRDAIDQHKPLAATGWALPAFLRSLGTPIMDGFIPWMKVRAYLADTEGWSRANPGQVGSEAERLAFQRYAREIDQRFGEMATSNLFWNRWVTGLLHGSMLSFGWNYGLVSQMLGGGKDVAQRVTRTIQGREVDTLRTRLPYATLYTAYGLGLGFLMTRFIGGQPIQSLKDGVYPVMRTEPDGTAYRVKMPGWLQDFGATYYHVQVEGVAAGVADEAANKTAPMLSLLHQLWSNQNYYGQQIRDPMDPWYMQLGESAHAAFSATVPFTLSNFLQQQSDPQGPGTLVNLTTNVLGITQAASYTREPIPVQKIFWLQHSQGLSGVTPYARAVRDDGMRAYHLRELYQQGKASGDYTNFLKAMREVQAKYGLTHRQARYEMERFAAPAGAFTLRELPLSDQREVWNGMKDDPALLRKYYPYFNQQFRNQALTSDPALLQALRAASP